MKSKSIYKYVWLGTSLRFLQDAAEGHLVHGDGWIISNIDTFLLCLDEFNLHVTKRASSDLTIYRDEMFKKPEVYKLTSDDAYRLKLIMRVLRETLLAESDEKYIYVVSDKRLDLEKLLNDPGALLRPGVFQEMSTIAQYDFREACLCIAFERSTAAAYHLLRATEEVLRQYYRQVVKKKRIGSIMWKAILDALVVRKKISTSLSNNLDYIRNNYRNPTDHPEMVYDIDEVQDLFGLCVEAIHKMLSEIRPKIKK